MAVRLSIKQAQLVQRHRYILHKLANSNVKDRKTILKNAPSDLFKVIDIIFKLFANDRIQLSKKHQTRITKHKKLIRSSSKLGTKAIKEKLTRQRGGSFQSFLSTVLPVIGAIVKAVI